MSRAASPPVERICAIAIADGVELPFEVPPKIPTARGEGWTIFFFLQHSGREPVETMMELAPGIAAYDDHDARQLWEKCR